MNKKVLFCDIDEVLWEMMPTWCETYNKLPTTNQIVTPQMMTSWHISDIIGEDEAQNFYSILNQDSFWDEVVRNQDLLYTRNTYSRLVLLMQKYDLYIVTATDYTKSHKLDLFLNLYDCINKNQLILLSDKWLLDADIIIDDRAETLQKFAEKGTRCVKIYHPWNAWYECESYPHFIIAANRLLEEV